MNSKLIKDWNAHSKIFEEWNYVLDEGCGAGQSTIHAEKFGHNAVGIDISFSNLQIAKKNKRKYSCNFLLACCDARHLPFRENTFDIALSAGVFEHFRETEKAIEEAYRVVKKNGKLLVHVPQRFGFFILNKLLQQMFGFWKIGYERSFSARDFTSKLISAGFCVLDCKISEVYPGKKFPALGKAMRILDKPLLCLGFGGASYSFFMQEINISEKIHISYCVFSKSIFQAC